MLRGGAVDGLGGANAGQAEPLNPIIVGQGYGTNGPRNPGVARGCKHKEPLH